MMAFTFAQARQLKPEQVNPFSNLLSKALQGYGQGVQAAYMPRQLEADIFHKTISPLAMLASSPFFSALNPEQQQQIGSYISQMLSNSPGMAGGMPNGQQGMGGMQGAPEGGRQGYQVGQPPSSGGGSLLTPKNPAGHFTQGFTESSLTPGKPHTDEYGNTISTPTSSQVEQQQAIISGNRNLDKLFNKYVKLAPDIATAGEVNADLSQLAGGISKLPLGGVEKKIASLLGGSDLAQKKADYLDLQAKMRPEFKKIGLNEKEIDSILTIRGGESGQHYVDRLMKTGNYLTSLNKNAKATLSSGYNLSAPGAKSPAVPGVREKAPVIKSIEDKMAADEKARKNAEVTADYFKTTPQKVLEAQSHGIKNAAQMREWLKNNK